MKYLYVLVILISSTSFAQEISNSCKSDVSGSIINIHTDSAIENARIHLTLDGTLIKETKTDVNGNFSFSQLQCDKDYQVEALKENFTNDIKLVFSSKTISKTHHIKLKLTPIQEIIESDSEKILIVKPINFIPDSYELTSYSKIQLKKVFDILEKYKHINIEIAFHTDSRGSLSFLKELSQKRAEACADYLSRNGIDASRMTPVGYGASQLLNHCNKKAKCTNKEHLVNKRSIFRIIE